MRYKRVLHQPNAVDRAKMPLDDLGLDPAVRELAERHLTKGDVWRFLRDVGLEVQRFEKEGNELKERESDSTERFVTQVIEVREEEHRAAWHKYKALMEVLDKAKAGKIDLEQLMSDRAMGEAIRRSMGQDTLDDASASNPSQCTFGPGVEGRDTWLYPAARPSGYVHVPTRMQSVTARATATPTSSSQASAPATASTDMGRGDSASSSLTALPPPSAPWPLATPLPTGHSLPPTQTVPYTPTATSTALFVHSPASSLGLSPGAPLCFNTSCPTTASLDRPTSGGGSTGVGMLRGTWGVGAASAPSAPVLPLVLGGVSLEEAEMVRRGAALDRSLGRQADKGARMSASDAEFVRGAAAFLTEGLEDSVGRLLRVAVCRAFVPSSMDPDMTGGREAYERLIRLPVHALARRRHVDEAWAYAQRLTKNMEFEGYRRIGDLVPVRRHASVLQERLGVSPELVGVIADIARALQTCTPLSKILKPRTWCRYDSMRHARYLFSRLRSNGWWAQRYHHRAPLAPPITTTLRLMATASSQSPLAYNPATPPACLMPPPASVSVRALLTGGSIGQSSPPHTSNCGTGPPLSHVITTLLRDEAQWGTLHGPIDRFLTMAAFYILPHPPVAPAPGPSALVAFIAELQAMHDEDERRRALKLRYQRCLQLSMPYVRRLRAAGVLRVKDLCRVDLPSWRLEPAYAKQVEDMAAKLLAKHLYAKATGRTREQEARYMSGAFDPRFQRSATDPYGRPPRLEAIRSKIREDHEGLGLQWATDDVPMPQGLWAHESQFPEDELDEEVSTESSMAGKRKGGQWCHRKETERDDDEEQREDKARGGDADDEAWYDRLTRRRSTTGALGSISRLSAGTKGASDASTRSSKTSASQKGPKNNLKASSENKPRTFICRHAGCAQPFLHLSTLRAHERTHAVFPEYHRWKAQAQIYRDSPFQPHIPEYLPPYRIRNELERLRRQGEDSKAEGGLGFAAY